MHLVLHILLGYGCTAQAPNDVHAKNQDVSPQRDSFWSIVSTLTEQIMIKVTPYVIAFFTRYPQPQTEQQYFIEQEFDSQSWSMLWKEI
jgi:hypothetical protein